MLKRINEVGQFGCWARIAPAFSAGTGSYHSSADELIDRCVYTAWDTWAGSRCTRFWAAIEIEYL